MYNLTNDTELEHTYMFKWFHRRKDNHSNHLSEFKERLNFAFELYNKLRKGNRRVGIYIPGSVHTANGIQDQYSLSFAGVKYLTKLGIPIESLLGDEYNQKYKG